MGSIRATDCEIPSKLESLSPTQRFDDEINYCSSDDDCVLYKSDDDDVLQGSHDVDLMYISKRNPYDSDEGSYCSFSKHYDNDDDSMLFGSSKKEMPIQRTEVQKGVADNSKTFDLLEKRANRNRSSTTANKQRILKTQRTPVAQSPQTSSETEGCIESNAASFRRKVKPWENLLRIESKPTSKSVDERTNDNNIDYIAPVQLTPEDDTDSCSISVGKKDEGSIEGGLSLGEEQQAFTNQVDGEDLTGIAFINPKTGKELSARVLGSVQNTEFLTTHNKSYRQFIDNLSDNGNADEHMNSLILSEKSPKRYHAGDPTIGKELRGKSVLQQVRHCERESNQSNLHDNETGNSSHSHEQYQESGKMVGDGIEKHNQHLSYSILSREHAIKDQNEDVKILGNIPGENLKAPQDSELLSQGKGKDGEMVNDDWRKEQKVLTYGNVNNSEADDDSINNCDNGSSMSGSDSDYNFKHYPAQGTIGMFGMANSVKPISIDKHIDHAENDQKINCGVTASMISSRSHRMHIEPLLSDDDDDVDAAVDEAFRAFVELSRTRNYRSNHGDKEENAASENDEKYNDDEASTYDFHDRRFRKIFDTASTDERSNFIQCDEDDADTSATSCNNDNESKSIIKIQVDTCSSCDNEGEEDSIEDAINSDDLDAVTTVNEYLQSVRSSRYHVELQCEQPLSSKVTGKTFCAIEAYEEFPGKELVAEAGVSKIDLNNGSANVCETKILGFVDSTNSRDTPLLPQRTATQNNLTKQKRTQGSDVANNDCKNTNQDNVKYLIVECANVEKSLGGVQACKSIEVLTDSNSSVFEAFPKESLSKKLFVEVKYPNNYILEKDMDHALDSQNASLRDVSSHERNSEHHLTMTIPLKTTGSSEKIPLAENFIERNITLQVNNIDDRELQMNELRLGSNAASVIHKTSTHVDRAPCDCPCDISTRSPTNSNQIEATATSFIPNVCEGNVSSELQDGKLDFYAELLLRSRKDSESDEDVYCSEDWNVKYERLDYQHCDVRDSQGEQSTNSTQMLDLRPIDPSSHEIVGSLKMKFCKIESQSPGISEYSTDEYNNENYDDTDDYHSDSENLDYYQVEGLDSIWKEDIGKVLLSNDYGNDSIEHGGKTNLTEQVMPTLNSDLACVTANEDEVPFVKSDNISQDHGEEGTCNDPEDRGNGNLRAIAIANLLKNWGDTAKTANQTQERAAIDRKRASGALQHISPIDRDDSVLKQGGAVHEQRHFTASINIANSDVNRTAGKIVAFSANLLSETEVAPSLRKPRRSKKKSKSSALAKKALPHGMTLVKVKRPKPQASMPKLVGGLALMENNEIMKGLSQTEYSRKLWIDMQMNANRREWECYKKALQDGVTESEKVISLIRGSYTAFERYSVALDLICRDIYVESDGQLVTDLKRIELEATGYVSKALRSSTTLKPVIQSLNRLKDELDHHVPLMEAACVEANKIAEEVIARVNLLEAHGEELLVFKPINQAEDEVQAGFGGLMLSIGSFSTCEDSSGRCGSQQEVRQDRWLHEASYRNATRMGRAVFIKVRKEYQDLLKDIIAFDDDRRCRLKETLHSFLARRRRFLHCAGEALASVSLALKKDILSRKGNEDIDGMAIDAALKELSQSKLRAPDYNISSNITSSEVISREKRYLPLQDQSKRVDINLAVLGNDLSESAYVEERKIIEVLVGSEWQLALAVLTRDYYLHVFITNFITDESIFDYERISAKALSQVLKSPNPDASVRLTCCEIKSCFDLVELSANSNASSGAIDPRMLTLIPKGKFQNIGRFSILRRKKYISNSELTIRFRNENEAWLLVNSVKCITANSEYEAITSKLG